MGRVHLRSRGRYLSMSAASYMGEAGIMNTWTCFVAGMDGSSSCLVIFFAKPTRLACKPNIGSFIFLAHFDWHYYQVGRQLLGRSCDHERLDLLRCRLSVIYIIFSTIGLELWTTCYRLPGLEGISVADRLDNKAPNICALSSTLDFDLVRVPVCRFEPARL